MDSSSVLVGIVTRNRGELLPKAIQSALAQDAANLRVAVLDDGSTDKTPQLQQDFPQVQWTRWEKSRGLIEARNYLMRSATESYFVSLDDDAWFLQGDEISKAAKYLEENRSVAAIAFDILSPDSPQVRQRTNAQRTAMFVGCGHMVRLDCLREIGFYESSPGTYGSEEKDLGLRLIDAGYQIVLLSGVHVWHDKTTIERHTPMQHRSGVCNDLAMTFRRTPLWLLSIAVLSKCYRHLSFSFKNQLTKPCLSGFWLFLCSTPKLWHSRKPVKTSTIRTFMRLRAR